MKLAEQTIEPPAALITGQFWIDLEHRGNIFLDRELAEHRRFLRQIAEATARAEIHRQAGKIIGIEMDGAALTFD